MAGQSLFRRSISAVNAKSTPHHEGDDFEYAERCAYWLERANERPKNFRIRRRDRTPLILNGHGVGLRIDRGSLQIRNGLTHVPQDREEIRLFRGELNLPSRILLLEGSGSISFDVLRWLAEQTIPLICLDWRGEVVTVVGATGYSADRKMVARQIAAHEHGKAKQIAKWLISEKLRNSIRTIQLVAPESAVKIRAIEYAREQARSLAENKGLRHSVLGTEANSAALYFRAFLGMKISWKGNRPIPPDWRRVGPRTSAITNRQRGARHPVNALLNYGYSVLQALVRTRIIAAGMDPTIGIMHKLADRERDDLVFDLMEPARTLVDRAVFEMVRDDIFSTADFLITPEGVCRLNPQLARTIVRLVETQIAHAVPKSPLETFALRRRKSR